MIIHNRSNLFIIHITIWGLLALNTRSFEMNERINVQIIFKIYISEYIHSPYFIKDSLQSKMLAEISQLRLTLSIGHSLL